MKKNNISIVLIVTVLVSFLCGIIGASLAGITTKTAASVANGNIKIRVLVLVSPIVFQNQLQKFMIQ